MKLLSSLAVAGLLLAASPLFAETVTVGPGQSLQEASDRLQPGDTLLLEEGTYYQSLKLTRSGTAGNPITIKAKTPGKVVITGAMETTPKFERVEGAIYKPVPASITAGLGSSPKLEQVDGAIYKTKWVPAKTWKGSGTGHVWVIADDRNL